VVLVGRHLDGSKAITFNCDYFFFSYFHIIQVLDVPLAGYALVTNPWVVPAIRPLDKTVVGKRIPETAVVRLDGCVLSSC